MPSDLQRVAHGLVECLDEVPQVVLHLQRTAERCRENAAVAIAASHGQATVAAQQLDAAARACEQAAHYLSLAPPKAKAWALRLIGDGGGSSRPDPSSPDRNKTTGGIGDVAERDEEGRTKRLSAPLKPLEDVEGSEPPLIQVARKAFEKLRKKQEKDEEEERPVEPLEVEIVIGEDGRAVLVEREDEEDRDDERPEYEIKVDLTAAQDLLAAMAADNQQPWQHAKLTITPDHVTATFDYPDKPPTPPVVDIALPDLPTPDFDPAFDARPLGPDFAPGVHDPHGSFVPKELEIARRLQEKGWRVDARPADHSTPGKKNPDVMLRRNAGDEGVVVEFKTVERASTTAVKSNILTGSKQVGPLGEVVIDGRNVGLTADIADRGYRRARGQPGKIVASAIHVILGDGRMVTYTKE